MLRGIRKFKNDNLKNPKNINPSFNDKRMQRELSRYSYHHRRFCHASSQAISLLHTVCNIKKIVIPEKIPLCDICAAQNLKKRQPKKLAENAAEPLALISFDVAGPFPPYRGYRYFGELIDNWSRKTWTLLFKD